MPDSHTCADSESKCPVPMHIKMHSHVDLNLWCEAKPAMLSVCLRLMLHRSSADG